MWIPAVQVDGILTGTEGGGGILVDYALSWQEDRGWNRNCWHVNFLKEIGSGPQILQRRHWAFILLTLSVFVPKPAVSVAGVLVHTLGPWWEGPSLIVTLRMWIHQIHNCLSSKLKLVLKLPMFPVSPRTSEHSSTDTPRSSSMWNLYREFALSLLYVLEAAG